MVGLVQSTDGAWRLPSYYNVSIYTVDYIHYVTETIRHYRYLESLFWASQAQLVVMTVGLINTCYVDFLKSRMSEAAIAALLGASGLPADAAFVSTCPYADSLLER